MTFSAGPQDKLAELAPIGARKSLAEEAADQLRDFILLERLAPGEPIRERDLADALGISRTPLREALRLLEIEGLVEYSPTRRPFVADPDLDTLAQNLSVLGALEGLAGEQACANATDAQIREIGSICRQMIERSDLDDPLTFFRRDMAFHETIVTASGNRPLAETQRQYNARLWRARFISSQRQPDRPRTLYQHEEVFKALERRDARACRQALRTHLSTTVENIAKTRSEQEHEAQKK
ncbi:GntR family transcriptional regulator [Qingshengfaniella alkalisoli]|uniref:GntR family transcriptional regulator n=1 Tax=Qingshengfaniella alkalisoli TaxID=2599296 RepID=A0A5B8I9Y4_9RHOB|nr:GntR family transcriptional regulator [Qingshengfaniella alkalisoli]QDY71175.1 GntR family transcriptional regulator [Qingshengfaniella alkalisoli]